MIPIYDACGHGLGDLWATINHYAHMTESTGVPTYMSRWVRPNGIGGDGEWRDDKGQMLEIIDCLNIPYGCAPTIVDDKPTQPGGMSMWAKPYYPTKLRWGRSTPPYHFISYQFDGISCANDKNPTPAEVAMFDVWKQNKTLACFCLGKPRTLENCIRSLAMSDIFVGACSGLSHVAISVGLPVHLLEYKVKVYGWYQLDKVIIHQGMQAFISSVEDQFPLCTDRNSESHR